MLPHKIISLCNVMVVDRLETEEDDRKHGWGKGRAEGCYFIGLHICDLRKGNLAWSDIKI